MRTRTALFVTISASILCCIVSSVLITRGTPNVLAGTGPLTPTPTPPTPGIRKLPEGNTVNIIPNIPAANLWICEVGPCSGPGEGTLRVVEQAFGVTGGLGAYELTIAYDHTVIQSVNPCDLVFGPTGSGAVRGPVDELDTSAANPDCAPDPGTAGNGTCSLSIMLEGLVHFGCATGGQSPGPNGAFALASLLLMPHPDIAKDLTPALLNGVMTVVQGRSCELADSLGHPVPGSVQGGLTPRCGDLAVTVRVLEADFDLDCDVDAGDAQAVTSRYGASFGGMLYDKRFDLEPAVRDLDVDIKDVQRVYARLGSTCQAPVPDQRPRGPDSPFWP
jgi:hypothetical protein